MRCLAGLVGYFLLGLALGTVAMGVLVCWGGETMGGLALFVGGSLALCNMVSGD